MAVILAPYVLSFCRETIDQEWWNRRIAVAHDVRRTLGLTDNPEWLPKKSTGGGA